ncbi:hypothetical protein D9M71_822750 [compost metagenome]
MTEVVRFELATLPYADLTLERNAEGCEVNEMHRIGTPFDTQELDVLGAEGDEKVQFVEHREAHSLLLHACMQVTFARNVYAHSCIRQHK